MGISVALSNALSGMRVGQSALEVVSSNVANAGTPGYNRRSVSVIDSLGASSTWAREGAVTRAFNMSLQQHLTGTLSETGFASVRADYVNRVQTLFGKPGTTGSLDSTFNAFQTSLSTLASNTDSFASRADTVQKAQALAGTLNQLTTDIQSLRQEVESQLGSSVDTLNSELASLEKINNRLGDQGIDATSRATLLDQRDRLVSSLSEKLDLRVTYRNDDTVALMTTSGVGILDVKRSIFAFDQAGTLSPTSQFNTDDAKSGVGKLTLTTPSGLSIDLVKQNVLQSGTIAAYVELRDKTLVQAQDQLDEIAAALAQSMSTNVTEGDVATAGAASGYDIDLADVRNGNEISFSYLSGGVTRTVRALRVDDLTKLPMDYVDANGARVIGVDFSGGAGSVATQLQNAIGPALNISSPGGDTLRVLDDGAAGTTDIVTLKSRTTATGTQADGLGVSLFVDYGDTDFTNALDGIGQKRGFAGRIRVNSAIATDNTLLVKYESTTSLGDASRVNALIDNLDSLRFAGALSASGTDSSFRLTGTVSDFINQTINFQGNAAAAALAENDTQLLSLEALNQRLDSEYAVNVDEEMARLMELQNAYAANARVLSVVQELLDALMNA
jgi:flagellar hook-associated protein 1